MPKVVVGLLDAAQEFQQLQAEDAREAASRLKLDVEVTLRRGPRRRPDPAALQAHPRAARGAAGGDRRGAGHGEGLERVARNAVKAGIGWILVNAEVALPRRAPRGARRAADRGRRHRPARSGADPGPPGARPRPGGRARAVRAGAGGGGGDRPPPGRPEAGPGRPASRSAASTGIGPRRAARRPSRRGCASRPPRPSGRTSSPARTTRWRSARARPCASTAASGGTCPCWAATACPGAARSRSRRAAWRARS